MKETLMMGVKPLTASIATLAAAWGIPELIEAVDLLMTFVKGGMSIAILGATFVYWRLKIKKESNK